MYNPHDPYGQRRAPEPFPELHDQEFWALIVDRTRIPPARPPRVPSPHQHQPKPEYSIHPVYEPNALVIDSYLVLGPALPAPSREGAHRGQIAQAPEVKQRQHAGTWSVLFWVSIGLILIGVLFGNIRPASPPPAPGYALAASPSISADFINQVLAYYHSPAAGKGQALYDLGVQYGIDPAFALAFFMHESTFGTRGEATKTLALGNERCIPDRPCVDRDRGGYAQFSSWEDGFAHWYLLITGPVYKGARLVTVDQIIPRYAPSSDNNDEQAYISAIKHAVDTWRAGKIQVT